MAKWCWTRPLLTLGSSIRCSPSFSLEDSAELSDKHPPPPPVHFTLLAGLRLQLLSELQSFSQWEEETGKLKLSTRTPGHLLSYFMFKCSTELGQAERLCYWCGGKGQANRTCHSLRTRSRIPSWWSTAEREGWHHLLRCSSLWISFPALWASVAAGDQDTLDKQCALVKLGYKAFPMLDGLQDLWRLLRISG